MEANSNNISPPVDQCLNLVPIHNQTSSCKIQYFPVVLYLFAAYSLTVYVQNAIQSTDINEIQRVAEIYNRAILFCDDMFLTILNIFNIIRISLSLDLHCLLLHFKYTFSSPSYSLPCQIHSLTIPSNTPETLSIFPLFLYHIFLCERQHIRLYLKDSPQVLPDISEDHSAFVSYVSLEDQSCLGHKPLQLEALRQLPAP